MATTTNFGWETPDDTDLVKDGAAAIRTLGQSIDTSMADLEGGTTGQVLSKASNADMDFTWVTSDDANAIQNSIVDAKGDLIAATANDTPARLAVGTNGQVLTADSTAATGLKWASVSSGAVVQVKSFTKTNVFSTSSTSFVDITDLAISITPTSASNKILVIASVQGAADVTLTQGMLQLMRGSTAIAIGDAASSRTRCTVEFATTLTYMASNTLSILDSPATTSATTYKVQMRVGSSTGYINQTVSDNDGSYDGRGASTITVMEVTP